jgi:GTP-binding protein
MRRPLRNIAIIAHVDHGKTTLVDKLLQQAGTFAAHQHLIERVMDSGDIERERGITILAKNTAVDYHGVHINIVDTPGHADFGGEVERVLSMVDGVLLLVDAVEGPMPQTRFVTRKALAQGLKPILVVNKVDRDGARSDWVVDQTFDLMDKLGATEDQLDFPVIYASALHGWASTQVDEVGTDMRPLFDAVLKYVPEPKGDPDGALQLQIAAVDYSSFLGRIAVGRIRRGSIKKAQEVAIMSGDKFIRKAKIGLLHTFQGLEKVETPVASAGEIVSVTGIEDFVIGTTFADPLVPEGLAMVGVDEPRRFGIAARNGINHRHLIGIGGLASEGVLPRFEVEAAIDSRQAASGQAEFRI